MNDHDAQKINILFFGTSRFSILVLDELHTAGYTPRLIVTVPDKPKGRKLVLTKPDIVAWAETHNVPYIQPVNLKTRDISQEIQSYSQSGYDVGIVASYGKIIPENILNIPKHETLNVHPSLLPRLRGASPIQSSILTENETGVTIMHLDPLLDHGPIVIQEKVTIPEWPPYAHDLETILGTRGGQLLSDILPNWIAHTIQEKEQDHSKMTTCQKIEKSDAEIDLSDDPDKNLRKIRAYHTWPRAYYTDTSHSPHTRIIITRAHTEKGTLIIEKIIPEGKKEMKYEDYMRNIH